VRLSDIEWVVPHQPERVGLLRSILQALEIDPARTIQVVQDTGSVGAASIPDRPGPAAAARAPGAPPGPPFLMLGIGAGVSRGACSIKWGRWGRWGVLVLSADRHIRRGWVAGWRRSSASPLRGLGLPALLEPGAKLIVGYTAGPWPWTCAC